MLLPAPPPHGRGKHGHRCGIPRRRRPLVRCAIGNLAGNVSLLPKNRIAASGWRFWFISCVAATGPPDLGHRTTFIPTAPFNA